MEDQPKIRRPAVAGTFYSDNASQLRVDVARFLSDIKTKAPAPKAIIAPHAGYVYSAPVAASVYARLKNAKQKIERVILLGPSHRVGFYGIAATSFEYYETPLGQIPLDKDAMNLMTALPQVQIIDQAHAQEHSLEVHLPFLQILLKDFLLVPLVVGTAKPVEVSDVLEMLWGGVETLIVISTDLSHYKDYESAKKTDARTCESVEHMRPQNIKSEDACGRFPMNGFLHLAKQKGLKAETVDIRNSGDTAGSKNSVVGYGAWAFYN